MTVLELRGLHVWFDVPGGAVHAVRGVSLAVSPGERVGVVGESGCGKSTLLHATMGLLPPNAAVAGRVVVGGEELVEGGENAFRRHRWTDVAIVFQGTLNALNPVRTIGSQITEPMEVHRQATGDAARRRAGELLELVRLPATTARRYPHELSGGMRQRAAIAMALACGPHVLLADEPTTALDVMVQAQVLEVLARLGRDHGQALVLVSHDLLVVAEVCERAVVMYAGEVVESAPVRRLVDSPAHPYTRMLFAAVPDIDAGGVTSSIPGVPPSLQHDEPGCAFRPRCPLAHDRCALEPPRLRPVAPGHSVACHLHDTAVETKSIEARP
ncbi:MAG TPA: ABC transporter ATP-binding protein [Acidimicrobiales bacterium]|nr:ABC transporter ATP-binding protein [Acidimicrobiales bacterium]